jgi:rare lipoprotein A
MRSPVENFAGRARGRVLGLIVLPALTACGSPAGLASASAVPVKTNGPAADFPVVIGAPYKVGSTLYTPIDTLNYDEVGYVAADGGTGVTGSHHTLPLPSYVEVTSLATGHTILVRLERRGPMDGNAVVALSPAALAQLGASAGTPVRVRRVNPPERERAALRADRTVPPRMDTPESLLAVLKQKLPVEGSTNLAPQKSAPPAALASVELPPSKAAQPLLSTPVATAKAAPAPVTVSVTSQRVPPPLAPLSSRAAAPVTTAPAQIATVRQERTPAPRSSRPAQSSSAATDGAYIVQAATMSTLERARKVAGSIGGSVSPAGRYFRVRTGPFATREQAEASLAKVRAAGYSDARIFTNG